MSENQYFDDSINEEIDKETGGFLKLETGQNKFRIVSPFAWGYKFNFKNSAEGKEKGHPFYKRDAAEVEENMSKLQLACCMVVYDYRTKELKTVTFHQKKILKGIRDYTQNEEFGDPTGFDLTVTKEGSGKETRYTSVMANPPKALSEEVVEALKSIKFEMNNAYISESVIVEA